MNFPSHLQTSHRSGLYSIVLLLAMSLGWMMPRALAAIPVPAMPAAGDLPVRVAMPDPLVTDDGLKITTATQWKQRREEMKRIVEYYELGHAPPPPGNVVGHELLSRTVLDGKVTCRLVHLTFGPGGKLGFDVNIFIPAETEAIKAPFPTIVQPSFNANHSPDQSLDSWETAAHQYDEPLRRGYAIVTFYYQQCGLDNKINYRQSGFFPAYPGYDWADLAAWAWAMSRCVDYLETQPFADKSEILAVGHSRLGKTALIAGAFDERFALTAPAGSGCGGTGAYRFNGHSRNGKQGLEEVTKSFPQWFSPRLAEFSGQVEKLPFDQHWLMALVAPRMLIATDAWKDSGNEMIQSYLATKPVYAFLGAPDHLGLHFRPGPHQLAPEDWLAILDFSDQQLRHMNVNRRFDQLPTADQFRNSEDAAKSGAAR